VWPILIILHPHKVLYAVLILLVLLSLPKIWIFHPLTFYPIVLSAPSQNSLHLF